MSSDSSDFLKDKKKKYMEEIESLPAMDRDYTTVSSVPIDILYTPDDVEDIDFMREIGFPGEYPFTRGVHKNMYRGKLWTMRMFSGMGSAKDTNERYHFLLDGGQTGLSVAFDLPTLYGYDSDQPTSHGEVGKCGVAIDSLKDITFKEAKDLFEKNFITSALRQAQYKVAATAKKIGISRPTLYDLMKKHGISIKVEAKLEE